MTPSSSGIVTGEAGPDANHTSPQTSENMLLRSMFPGDLSGEAWTIFVCLGTGECDFTDAELGKTLWLAISKDPCQCLL